MFRAVGIAAVIALTLPSAASASALDESGAAPAATRSQTTAHEWVAQQRAILVRAGAVSYTAGGADLAGWASVEEVSLQPVGRLGTSKHADVLDVRRSSSFNAVGITARVGSTGRRLWSVRIHPSSLQDVSAFATPLGASDRRSVLIVEQSEDQKIDRATLTLRAISATGRQLWKRSMSGSYGGDANKLPFFDGLLPDPHHVTNVLAEARSMTSTALTTQADIVSGATGTIKALGTPATAHFSPPIFTPIPDANGDGRADVLLEVPDGATGYVSAESSVSGTVMWTDDLVIGGTPIVTVLGRLEDGADPDLAIQTQTPPGDTTYLVAVMSGRETFTNGLSGDAVAIDRVGPAQQRVLVVYNGSSTSSTTDTSATLTYTAYTVGGAVWYTKHASVSVTNPTGTTVTDGSAQLSSIGDLQSDGSPDLHAVLSAEAASPSVHHVKVLQGIVDGHTGRFTRFTFAAPADGSLRKGGSSTDLLNVVLSKGRPRLTAWHGANRRRYYRTTISALHGWKATWVSGLRATGHSCSDIALANENSSHGALGVLSASGSLLWSVAFRASQVTGGTLTRHKAPKHFCV